MRWRRSERLWAARELGESAVLDAHGAAWRVHSARARTVVAAVRSEGDAAVRRELWPLLWDMGGALFVTDERLWGFYRIGHVSWMRALVLPKRWLNDMDEEEAEAAGEEEAAAEEEEGVRCFVVSDPEAQWAKLLREQEVTALLRSPQLRFTLTPWEQRTPPPHA